MTAHSLHRRRSECRPAGRASTIESLENRLLFVRVSGIDVSQFQGVIDWNQIAASGFQFVFMRGSRTNLTKDPTFETNLAGARAAGLLVGTYHFTLPNSNGETGPKTDPIADAQKFFAAAGAAMGTGFLPPVIDSEAGSSLGKTELSNWVNDFSVELERLTGVVPIVYANSNYAKNFLNASVAARHPLWLARYNAGNDPTQVDPQVTLPETPSGFPNSFGEWNVPVGGPPSDESWSFWQYTSRGDGPSFGVSSTFLDLDLFNGSYDQLKERFEIGFQKNFNSSGNATGSFGVPFAVGPGVTTTIEAENYDFGGDGISYSDSTPTANTGNVYRTGLRNAVDLAPINGTSGIAIADAVPGEYVEYTIDVAQSDDYKLDFTVSQAGDGAKIHVEVDGQAFSQVTIPNTIGFNTFGTATQNVAMTAGRHVLRVSFDSAASNNGLVAGLDNIQISEAPEPEPPPPTPDPSISTESAFVRGGIYASQNFGSATDLVVQRGRNGASTFLSYLRFDLTDKTSIASAKLRLTGRLSDNTSGPLTTGVFSIGKEKTPWQENSISAKRKPGPKKLRGLMTVTAATDASYEVDLTSYIQSEIAAGRKFITLVLKNATRSTTAQSIFASDDSATPPRLITT